MGGGSSSAAKRYFSDAQAPKSINLQRSEQKGNELFSARVVLVKGFLQVGHFTKLAAGR